MFFPGQDVRVSVSSGFTNVPNDEWDSKVITTTVYGNVVVRDRYGMAYRVSPACVTPL